MVTLECPYDNWNNPELVSMFGKMVGLKLRGYRKEYAYGVLPVDTTDFLAAHHLVCAEREGELVPYLGYKVITNRRCRMHNVTFPLVALLQASGATRHASAVSEILEKAEANRQSVSYASSWTAAPEVRGDTMFSSILNRYVMAYLVLHEQAEPVDVKLACGVPSQKTDRYLIRTGFQRLTDENGEMPVFQQASLKGEDVVVLRCDRYSDEAQRVASRYAKAWENRVVLGERLVNADLQETAAAA